MCHSNPNQAAIHATNPNYDRHVPCYTVRHFTHKSRSKILCAALLSLLVAAGLIASILWLSLRPHRPQVFVTDFRVLGQPNRLTDAVIIYRISICNPNRKIQIHYDSFYCRLLYRRDQRIGGTLVLTKLFDQAKKNTTLAGSLRGATLSSDSRWWPEFHHDRAAGTAAFKLQIWSVISFKAYAWDTQSHVMRADCYVAVGPKGVILEHYKRCCVFFALNNV